MSNKKRDLDMFKLVLKDLVLKGINDFGYGDTLKAITNIVMYFTDKEIEKEEGLENDKH